MEFRSPFGVTISMKTVIFMELTKCRHENPGGAQELRTLEIVMKTEFLRSSQGGSQGPLGSSNLPTTAPDLAIIAFSHDLSSLDFKYISFLNGASTRPDPQGVGGYVYKYIHIYIYVYIPGCKLCLRWVLLVLRASY